MRFLIFNIVVAGALIFLFAGDKADLHAAADRAHDVATDLKAKAFEVIGAREAAAPKETPKPVAQPAPVKPVTKKVAAKPMTEKSPIVLAEPAVEPAPGTAAAEAVREVQVATRKLVPPLPPEVERRREEVLAEGIVGKNAVRVDREAPSQKFMAASERKRDLILLSEEMELFSAQAISR